MPKLVEEWPEATVELESRVSEFRKWLTEAVKIAKQNPGKPVVVNDDELVNKQTYTDLDERLAVIGESISDFDHKWALMDRETKPLPNGKKSYKYRGRISIAYKGGKSARKS